MIELTDQQLSQFDASPSPPRLVNPHTQEAFVLVSAEEYDRLKRVEVGFRTKAGLIARVDFSLPASIAVQFQDDRRFELPIDKVPIDSTRVDWRTVVATASGEQIIVTGLKGDAVPIESETIRCLVDEQYAEQVRSELNKLRRNRAERRRSLQDMPAAPEWVFESSPDMRRDSWK